MEQSDGKNGSRRQRSIVKKPVVQKLAVVVTIGSMIPLELLCWSAAINVDERAGVAKEQEALRPVYDPGTIYIYSSRPKSLVFSN